MTNIEFEEYVKLLIKTERSSSFSMDDIATGFYGLHQDELVQDIRPLTKTDVLMFFEVFLLDYY